KTFVSASAIGYYGFITSEDVLTEESKAGHDFLAGVVKQWEDEIFQVEKLNVRTVAIRIGIVLSAEGGALKAMAAPVKWGFGAALGSGKQQIAWIHIDDLCAMFISALENENMSGAYNGVGLYAVSNKDFTKAIAKMLNRPFFLPNAPAFVMKLILGEMADMVLQGSAVSAEKILSTGFTFKYKTLEAALENLLKKE
ncbi:MAG TPA: TIGR01777 family oxidoreductase, partial [Cyclobacteriaceae bacterium]|nr:TIGR01777 family oxidoreductase [Cyclobacteriaceae bacterium]